MQPLLLTCVVYVHLWDLVAKVNLCVVRQAFNAFVLKIIRSEELGVGISFLHGCIVLSIGARPLFVDMHFVQNSLDLLLLCSGDARSAWVQLCRVCRCD